MNIYQATPKDMEGVANLFNQYRIFYEKSTDMDGASSFISERLEHGDSTIFVAVRDNDYVGFVQLYPTFSSISMKRAWILNDLYVTENARQQGVAQGLLDAAVQLGVETKAASLSLQTAPTNHNAQKLYEKNGFVKDDMYLTYSLDL